MGAGVYFIVPFGPYSIYPCLRARFLFGLLFTRYPVLVSRHQPVMVRAGFLLSGLRTVQEVSSNHYSSKMQFYGSANQARFKSA